MTMPESLMLKGRRDFEESAHNAKHDALLSIDTARDLVKSESWHEAIDALADAMHDIMHANVMRSRSETYAQCVSWGGEDE